MAYRLQKTADGSDTLYCVAYQQIFHSTHGALTETEHVFIQASGVAARLAHQEPVRILEVGFGTGLNFLATARLAEQAQAPLHYVALEKVLLPPPILEQLNHRELIGADSSLPDAFLTWRRSLADDPPVRSLTWAYNEVSQLALILGDATTVSIPNLAYQAIYHDAFSPESNPELWTEAMFGRLYEVLGAGGKLTTYSVKGTVRRAMQAVGFTVEKRPGPPGKREMLLAWK